MSFLDLSTSFLKIEVDYILPQTQKGCYSFVGSMFLFILLCNFLALFPFVFSTTSHLMVTLPLSYSFWLGIIIFGWVYSFKGFLSHLTPSGTPLGLIRFMVLVEVLRNLIRPIALTFRMTANIVAGHLLISLMGSALLSQSMFLLLLGSRVQFLLVGIELGVAIIQAYVFSTLLLLYLYESSC